MKINKLQKQIIVGSLLGDGCLAPRKNRKNTRFSILRKLDDLEYLSWQFSFLKDLCGTGIKTKSYFDNRTNKIYKSCYFTTLSSAELTFISNEWYCNGKKQVPNIVLTPLVLGIWLLDDGHINYTSSDKAIKITLSTNGFSHNDVIKLSKKLSDKFGGYFGVYPNKKNYVISCCTKPAIKLLKYISKVIPKHLMPRKTSYIEKFI